MTGEAAERAAHLRHLGRLEQAEYTLRTALAGDPHDATLLAELAATLLKAQRYADGLVAADAGVAAAPQDERGHRLRGQLLSRLGRHEEAVRAGYQSVALAPNEPYAALGYAIVLQRAKRLADAAKVARRAVELDPNSPTPHFIYADITSDLGDLRTARAAYQETLRLDPEHAEARHDLAVLDSRQRRPGRALRGLIDAGRLDPALPGVLTSVAAVLWQLSWRLRIWLMVATLAAILVSGAPDRSSWATRFAAAGVLAASAGLAWWTARDLPRQTWPVVRAAIRADFPLAATYAALAVCLAAYLVVLVTGVGWIAGLVWLTLLLLGWLALALNVTRRR